MHGHEGEGFWAEFIDLLQNPAHWGFEVISDLVVGGIFALAGFLVAKTRFKAWLKKHDAEEHKGLTKVEVQQMIEAEREAHEYMVHDLHD